jgi:chromosome segregation ATPase
MADLDNIERRVTELESFYRDIPELLNLRLAAMEGRIEPRLASLEKQAAMTTQDIRLLRTALRDLEVKFEGRLSGVEGRLSGVEGKLSGVEGKLSGVEGKLSNIEGDLTALRAGVSAILAHLGIVS